MRQDNDTEPSQRQADADVLALRLADREREYAQRIAFLDSAIAQFASGADVVDDAVAGVLTCARAVAAEVHREVCGRASFLVPPWSTA